MHPWWRPGVAKHIAEAWSIFVTTRNPVQSNAADVRAGACRQKVIEREDQKHLDGKKMQKIPELTPPWAFLLAPEPGTTKTNVRMTLEV